MERLSENIQETKIIRITNNDTYYFINFGIESSNYKQKIQGFDHNFNYDMAFLAVSYRLPSLAEKPYQQYSDKAVVTSQRRIEDIEYTTQYNDTTTDTDGRFHAAKLTLRMHQRTDTQRDVFSEILGEVYLYRYKIRVSLDLLQYLDSRVMSDDSYLSVQISNIINIDEVTLTASYRGTVNYTFDNGVIEHKHTFE